MDAPVSERACLIEVLLKLTRTAKRLRSFTRDPDLTQTTATALLKAAVEATETLSGMIEDLWDKARSSD